MLNNDIFTYIIAPLILGIFCLFVAEFCYTGKNEKKNRILFFSMGMVCILLQVLGAFLVISNCLQ